MTYRWPKALGARIDRLYALHQELKTIRKEVEAQMKKLAMMTAI